MFHDDSLEAVLNTFGAVIVTLEHTRETDDRDDQSVRHMVGCLIQYLLPKRFVMFAIWFQKLFIIITPFNTMLQIKTLDLLTAINGIQDVKKNLNILRQNDKSFKS